MAARQGRRTRAPPRPNLNPDPNPNPNSNPILEHLLAGHVRRHAVDDVDAPLVAVALDDLGRDVGQVPVRLDGHDALGPERRCNDREQPGAGTNLQHD